MKKFSVSFIVAFIISVCCLFGITAYASTDISTDDVNVELAGYSFTYSGAQRNPKATVSLADGTTLKKNVDYTIEYVNSVNAGTASAVVTGIGEYEGTKTVNYKIERKDITTSGINTKAGYTSAVYSGKEKTPKYTITFNDMTLVKNTDYTVTYSNNVKCGIATAKIKGTGNYKGTLTYKFKIKPAKVTSYKTSDRNTTSFTLGWTSQSKAGVTGYQVYKYDASSNKYKLYKTVTSNSCSVTDLKAGKYYFFKVRAYKRTDSGTLYGEYTDYYKTCTKPKKVTINNVSKSTKNSKIVVKWNKVSSDGYQIQYSTDKKFKTNVKSVTVSYKNNSKSISVSKPNKTYYARIRAYKKYNGKTVYGKWSNKLSTNYSKLYATYTTNYVNNPDRTTNLKISSAAINGTILNPGDTFSFNKVVGKRTKEKGYKDAVIFAGSNGHTMGLGGGICQVASTMFNTTLIANLQIVERHQHSQRVSYVPLGRDAAIYWGSYDYQFKNTTGYPLKIVMKCDNGQLTCSFYTCQDISPKAVDLKVTQNGNHFTLKRYVDGKVNYTTSSTY